MTTGERFQFDPSQDLSGHLGKVLRINAMVRCPPTIRSSDAVVCVPKSGRTDIAMSKVLRSIP